ncbi:SPASM domain-containing protein, partial [Thermodesulfobacteriota bacterium]
APSRPPPSPVITRFSVDGYDDASNDYLRGRKKSFAKALKALELFRDAKMALGSDRPLIAFNTVLSGHNFDHMREMVELAAATDVGMVNFEPITVHSPLGEALVLDDAQRGRLAEHARSAVRAAGELDVETNAGAYTGTELVENANTMKRVITGEGGGRDGAHSMLDIVCYEPWYHLVIKVDGQAGPCCIYNDRKISVKDAGLEAIWFGDHFAGIRETILSRKLPGYCSICNAGQVLANRAIRTELGRLLESESVEGGS